jgi:hypothetical protein
LETGIFLFIQSKVCLITCHRRHIWGCRLLKLWWVIEATLLPLCPQEKAPVHIVEEDAVGLENSLDGCGGEKIPFLPSSGKFKDLNHLMQDGADACWNFIKQTVL